MKRATIVAGAFLACMQWGCESEKENTHDVSEKVVRFERSDAAILKGFYVPQNTETFYTSGLVAPMLNPDAAPSSFLRYGNMEEQCRGTFDRIEETLALKGFRMKDVVFLRVYIAPDSSGKIDFQTFFAVYDDYFNNENNPVKVARSTIGVAALARPDLLVEMEAVAAK